MKMASPLKARGEARRPLFSTRSSQRTETQEEGRGWGLEMVQGSGPQVIGVYLQQIAFWDSYHYKENGKQKKKTKQRKSPDRQAGGRHPCHSFEQITPSLWAADPTNEKALSNPPALTPPCREQAVARRESALTHASPPAPPATSLATVCHAR